MWWATLGWALPPPGVDPADVGRWEAGSEALLSGPPGCWEFAGKIALVGTSYSPASRWTRAGRADRRFVGSFVGRLEGGTWTSFRYDLSPEDRPGEPAEIDFPVFPGVGRMAEGVARRTNPPEETEVSLSAGDGEAVNVLKQALEALEPSSATSYAEWRDDDRAVHLLQDFPASKGARAETVEVETTFPGGGAATALDATFPRRLRVGDGWMRATLFDAQLHLRSQPVGERVLPARESLSFGLGAFGFTLGYQQDLVFSTATPCPE